MGELLSMTSRDDKMLQYCSPEYSLDDSAKIEMLCTNLLLFGNNISRKIREKLRLKYLIVRIEYQSAIIIHHLLHLY